MKSDSDSLRTVAQTIWEAGLAAVRPRPLLMQAVTQLPTDCQEAIDHAPTLHVVGAGKAGRGMLEGLCAAMARHIPKMRGIINVPGDRPESCHGVLLHPARPVGSNHPTEAGVLGAAQMLDQLRQADPEDVAICLLSGGGSALLPAPAEGISLADKQALTRLLHRSGATIAEMNTLRKHLSRVKGGRLAEVFPGKRLISLIISDVVGDPLDVIASGPTVPDPSTFHDCRDIVQKYGLAAELPESVRQLLDNGLAGKIPETPKSLPERVANFLVGTNEIALQACSQVIRSYGLELVNLGSMIEGESREVAIALAGVVRSIQTGSSSFRKPVCLLMGGETTVTMGPNPGRGGRNQEFVLALLDKLGTTNMAGVCILSGGTDGEDGPTDAAGAIATLQTLQRAEQLQLRPQDYLLRHDSYSFLEPTEGLLKSGLTGTNVMDIRLIIVV